MTQTVADARLARRRSVLIVAAAAVAVLAVIVGAVLLRSDPEPPPAGIDPVATSPDELVGTWRPTWIADFPKLEASRPRPPHVSFTADDEWRGSDGCNGLGGEYDASPGELSAEPTDFTTAMACDNVPNDEVLTKTTRFRVAGTTLTLYDDAWTKLATYERTR
jgi:heat shock protein HslJ